MTIKRGRRLGISLTLLGLFILALCFWALQQSDDEMRPGSVAASASGGRERPEQFSPLELETHERLRNLLVDDRKEGSVPGRPVQLPDEGLPRNAEAEALKLELVQAATAAQSAGGISDNGGRAEAMLGAYQAYADRVAPVAEQARKYALTPQRIVYNRPKSLPFDTPSRLTASVASASLASAVRAVAAGAGEAKTGTALLAPKVRAELVGPSEQVTIQSTGDDVRLVSRAGNATWTWYVTPKTTAPIELRLAFYNVLTVDGVTGETDGPVYTDTFQINASAAQRARAALIDLQPYYAIVAGFITTFGGLFLWLKPWLPRRRSSGPEAK